MTDGARGDRDLVGYGETPPDPKWPGGAGVALNFVMNLEEGSEYSIGLGDGRSDATLTEITAARVPVGERDLAAESMFEYGSRVGFWRLRRLFAERNLPVTMFACALALEQNPDIAASVAASGWDVCAHGWRWVEHYRMDEATERAHIARAVTSLTKTTGRAPTGWYCRYGPSVATRRLLVEHGGFLYDSDAYNDEIPYWTHVDGRAHLVLPYSLAINDAKFIGGNLGTADAYFATLKDALDMLRADGHAGRGRMMSVGMHLRVLGHPSRAVGLARFLDYAMACGDVWICGRDAIARHWVTRFPPPAGLS